MTEYWKSQARKYCNFCKCWFADNKVSISYHENGKRHKESIQKHISQLSKKSAKDFKLQGKIDDDMKKMEAAAMSAYLKDVQNNADLTSKSINQMLEENGGSSKDITVGKELPIEKKEPLWQEVKSEDGSSYFWNKETNETTWDVPNEEYSSIADQEKKKQKKQAAKKAKKNLIEQNEKEMALEEKARIAREKMKELAVKKEPAPKFEATFGPAPASIPYGSWKPVVPVKVEKIDLQLPKTKQVAPPVVMEPEKVQFKEKRVDSLGDGPVEFKKRKFNNPKRNMRQKLDDD